MNRIYLFTTIKWNKILLIDVKYVGKNYLTIKIINKFFYKKITQLKFKMKNNKINLILI
jgi:hypothetical protein